MENGHFFTKIDKKSSNLLAIWKHLATNDVNTVEAAFFSSP